MHPFLLIGAVLHATGAAIVVFFIWFAASKASGLLKTFGVLLGWWLVLLAIVALGMAASGHGGRRGWMMMHEGDHPAPAAAPAATPATAAS